MKKEIHIFYILTIISDGKTVGIIYFSIYFFGIFKFSTMNISVTVKNSKYYLKRRYFLY